MSVRTLSRKASLTLLAAALLLAGCNMGATAEPTVDVNAINTAAVGTAMGEVSAQLTQTALAAPSPTSQATNMAPALPTALLPTSALPTAANALPTSNTGALPTLSFNTTPVAGFTQLASPVAPGATAALGDACDNNVFEGDVTIPDGDILDPGEDFVKQWAIRNTGTCTWDEGYALVFIAGDQAIDPVSFEFKKSSDFVSPGEGVNVGVPLTAPLAEGQYQGHWRMRNDKGYYFGTVLSIYFEVRKPKT